MTSLSATERNRVLLVRDGVIQWIYGWTVSYNSQTEQFLVEWDTLAYGLGASGWYFSEQLAPSSTVTEMPA